MTTVQKSAKNKADRLFSQLIRQHGVCERCNLPAGTVQLQCAHWISRRYAHTRTDFDNAFCLCAGCHRWFTDHPTEFGRWAIEQRGEAVYQRLLKVSQKRSKFDWIDELSRLEQLK